MMDMIRALYYGDLDAMELPLKPDSKYREVAEKISKVGDSLGEKGVDQEEFFQLMSDYENEISLAYFSLGLRWGAQLLLALLDDSDATFQPLRARGKGE